MESTGFRMNFNSSLRLLCPTTFCSFHLRRSSARKFTKTSSISLSSVPGKFNFSPQTSFEKVDASSLPHGPSEAVSESARDKLLNVVLVSPQIPGNTGSIARTCAASAVGLHLVEPMGFKIDDTKLKRAGLDYWPYVVVKVHGSWGEFINYFKHKDGEKRLLAFTKRGTNIHSDFSYKRGDWLIFGAETSGLPPEALLDCQNEPFGGGTLRIPMVETYVRCLNLSVSVGVALYEAARQLNYEQLQFAPAPCIDSQNSHVREDIFI
ncbi:hypothetical protein H6P81_001426 [Aristolochia fimbriata]|uniref:tRNA/rRNA methyltransferase SpoU type domain-containing protein n=1 Tax=Aristolochia fimbriata TaxID=158543 RepID=A0AAV7FBF5_ARIFI|nr:hypothetical protein H6P81_001426 [Aristolochia fimbriata]